MSKRKYKGIKIDWSKWPTAQELERARVRRFRMAVAALLRRMGIEVEA